MKKITAILIRTAVLTVFLSFHACTFVPLEDKSDLPESVSVNVNLNWSQERKSYRAAAAVRTARSGGPERTGHSIHDA